MQLMSLPRFPLAWLPTPLEPAQHLSAQLNHRVEIWVKRDDLTGLALGGNKTRKLEYLLGDALAHDATVLLTEGPIQSNHCRLTAAAAARCGLPCHLVLSALQPARVYQGNLLLDHLLGATLHFVPSPEERKVKLSELASRLSAHGERPYTIPTGGSTPVGVIGYVRAAIELFTQLMEQSLTTSRVYLATSTSGGTQAGLVLGAALLGTPFRIIGIAVESDAPTIQQRVASLANATAEFLGLAVRFDPQTILVDDRWVGPGYGVPDELTAEALHLAARTEGLILDPVYTAKAMAGLIGQIRRGEVDAGEKVIFWHTGGTPALFAQADLLAPNLDPRQ